MTGRGGRGVIRALAAAGLLAAILAAPSNTARAATTTATAVTPVTLNGEGSWDPYRELTGWQNDLFGSNGVVNLNYTPTGGFQGRQDYVAGNLDFVISGTPFTAPELKGLSGGANSYIQAPVFVGAIGMVVIPPRTSEVPTPPNNDGWVVIRETCDDGSDGTPPSDPNNPGSCDTFTVYQGPVRLPADNLAAMLFQAVPPAQALEDWDSQGVLNAWGITQADPQAPNGHDYGPPDLAPSAGPASPYLVLRSDPSETNYYLQEYVKQAAPSVWAAVVKSATNDGETVDPVTESLPLSLFTGESQLRDGVNQQALFAIEPTGNAANNVIAQGVILPVPASTLGQMQAFQPPDALGAQQRIEDATKAAVWAQIQNANGDWVAPSPASIDAAVDAGGDQPLAALTTSIPGAYPLVYVDDLYAPSHGLSVAKTEALATTIRYLATQGQANNASLGDGQLSPALVDQALAAANQVVLDNCVGSGAQLVTNSEPGPYAPADFPTDLGPMLHCTAAAATQASTTSTTIAAGGTSLTSPAPDQGGTQFTEPLVATGGSGGLPVVPVTQAVVPAPASSPSGGSTRVEALTISKLPLPTPGSDQSTFDRLTTMVAGAALLLLLLRIAKSVARGLGS